MRVSPAEAAHRLASARWKKKERGAYQPRPVDLAIAKRMLEESWEQPFYFRGGGSSDASGFARAFPEAHALILKETDAILAYKLKLFGQERDFGGLPDWNLDWKSRVAFPRSFYGDLNALSPPPGLSVKRVWELNRHQFLVTLGQAYFLSKDAKYADIALGWMSHWIDENPPYIGINWYESLEIGLRLLSWTWTLQLLQGAKIDRPETATIMSSLAAQFEFIARHLSTYSSPNTHLLGEQLALFVVGQTFPGLPNAGAIAASSKKALEEHMRKCVEADGSYFEKSAYYHCYALDMFLQAAILSEQRGVQFGAHWHAKLRAMTEFLALIVKPNSSVSRFGDDDGGRTLRVGENDYYQPQGLLQACQAFCEAGKAEGKTNSEVWWLLGDLGLEWLGEPRSVASSGPFRDADISILRDGQIWASLQGNSIARGTGGHSHAAFLSVELTVDGQDILIDPGTYAYENAWREAFRASSAHNGIQVDGKEWVEDAGPFRWDGKPPRISVKDGPNAIGRVLQASGWEFIRRVGIERGQFRIRDTFKSAKECALARWLHFAPQCDVRAVSENEFDILVGKPLLRMKMVSAGKLHCTLTKGGADKQGWTSPRYDEIEPSSALLIEEKLSSGTTEILFEEIR